MGTIRRRSAHGWEGVTAKAYPAFPGVEKHELTEGQGYRVRYFHVPAGGHTALERHPHDHSVVILAGRARVTLGEAIAEAGEGDVVYVEGDELHCFEALGEQDRGLICVAPPRPPG